MADDLRQRLRQLGVVRGARQLRASPRHLGIEELTPGRFHETPHGRCFVGESSFPPDHLHGTLPLAALLAQSPAVMACIACQPALAGAEPRRAVFLDLETTGLSGGTGTFAFIVGLGFFGEEEFELHQYFLRDPGDEPAMLHLLADRLPAFEAIVTFNGRGFDLPLLETRFALARLPPPLAGVPHLDLLFPARRLWRARLESCALSSLEPHVLGVRRAEDDVPSYLIPSLYRDYLYSGDARPMKRVLYHNGVDILSLVTLAARLCALFSDPWADGDLTGAEFYGLGRWYESVRPERESERAYCTALTLELRPELRAATLQRLAELLKRAGRRDEAFGFWQQLALETDETNVLAHVELAKYFEWHRVNLPLAAGWTRAALAAAEGWPPGLHRDQTLAELRYRLARLELKMSC